jgi:hypothetical protein
MGFLNLYALTSTLFIGLTFVIFPCGLCGYCWRSDSNAWSLVGEREEFFLVLPVRARRCSDDVKTGVFPWRR